MKPHNFRHSLTTMTALLVVLIALLAGGSLWILHRIHGQAAHAEAARHVLTEGGAIVAYLTEQQVVRDRGAVGADWSAFSRQVQALHAIEEGLQYVSVSRAGVTVFHEQTRGLGSDDSIAPGGVPPVPPDVDMTRKVIDLAGETVPVVVFRTHFADTDGTPCEVQIAVRKDTVDREERAAAGAIGTMFKLSLITVLFSFAVCALLVVWMMRREIKRERQRREEEHLAFAGVLANGIVHDFRNPMSAVRLDVQMLNKEAAKGEQCRRERIAELAGRVRETIDRMDKVFQEFLYMSKPPSDEREPIDLAAVVKGCANLLTARFEAARVGVDVQVPTQPVMVLAYPSALQRALMNVIINAEQVSKEGDLLQLRVVRGDRTATLDVIDSGPGVPAGDRERIFEMFVTGRPGGTGLGLFLARTAVERCGGSIRIVETSSRGSCFRITLPLAGEPMV